MFWRKKSNCEIDTLTESLGHLGGGVWVGRKKKAVEGDWRCK